MLGAAGGLQQEMLTMGMATATTRMHAYTHSRTTRAYFLHLSPSAAVLEEEPGLGAKRLGLTSAGCFGF